MLKHEYARNAGVAFLYGNVWEGLKGNIRFHTNLYSNAGNLNYLSGIIKGSISEAGHAETTFFTLYAYDRTDQQTTSGIGVFTPIYNHLTRLKNDMLITLSSVKSDAWSNSVRAINKQVNKSIMCEEKTVSY